MWMAIDTNADRPVALKFIKQHLLVEDSGFRTRFLNEARTLGRLEHDRIVRLYSVLNTEDALALVLAFIDGKSLASEIDQHGALPLPYVLAVAREVLPALAFAHERGIIHRDIKAENILIDRQGRAFLSDFGIAVTDFSQRGTATGSAIGTPSYMSPEQIKDSRGISAQTGGHRSDIYSFGVLLYEMLAGQLPFPGNDLSVIHAHLISQPPALRSINPNVSPAVEQVVMRCLSKEADARPQSCAELFHLLNEAATAPAYPPPPPPVSPGRAPTVLERDVAAAYNPPSGSGTVAMQQPAAGLPQAPRPAASAAASTSTASTAKTMWLAMGGILIAGGVGYTIWNSSSPTKSAEKQQQFTADPVAPPGKGNPSVATRPQGTFSNPTTPTQPATADSGAARAESLFVEARALASGGAYCEAKAKASEAVQLNSTVAKYQQLEREVIPKCVAAQNADRLAGEARVLAQAGKHCDGKRKIDEAIRLNPTSTAYSSLRDDLDRACGSTAESDRLAALAESQWNQGEYCAAQNTIQQAIDKNPAAAKKYEARRAAMAAGCRTSFQ